MKKIKFVLDGLYRFVLMFISVFVIDVWLVYFLLLPFPQRMMYCFGNGIIMSSAMTPIYFIYSLIVYPLKKLENTNAK